MSKNTIYIVVAVTILMFVATMTFMFAIKPASKTAVGPVPIIMETAATSSTEEPTTEYVEEIAEKMIEQTHGVKGKAIVEKPTQENVNGKKWILTVSVNSLGGTLALTEGKDESQWMDQVRFDSELTAFENQEKMAMQN